MSLIDRYGRVLNRARVSVTSRCNYRCVFCHNEGWRGSDELTLGDFEFLANALVRLGIRRFKITGGEPLIRPDLPQIAMAFKKAGAEDISLTTNGYFLSEHIDRLRRAVDRIDISLHTLDKSRYTYLMGVDGLDRVLNGLKEACDAGFKAVKANYLVLRGINDDELPRLVELASKWGFSIQVIELMPLGVDPGFYAKHHDDLSSVISWLERHGRIIGFRRLHNRPIYEVNGVIVEVVKNVENPIFCMGCTQIRITSDGLLKTCLYTRPILDLKPAIRRRDERALEAALRHACLLRRPRFMGDNSRGFDSPVITCEYKREFLW